MRLEGYFWSAVMRNYQQCDGCPRLIEAQWQQSLLLSMPTEGLVWQVFNDVMARMCHSTLHCTAAYGTAQLQTNQSANDGPCALSNVHTVYTEVSELDLETIEANWLLWWKTHYFASYGRPCTCATFTLGKVGTRTHCRVTTSWRMECDALDNVLLGNIDALVPLHDNDVSWGK